MKEVIIAQVLADHRKWTRGEGGQPANLYEADLRGADLSGANLHGASPTDARLSDADLRRANLRGADLRRADLSGANLYGANLSEAYLGGAYLYGASLRGAYLSRANLTECIGINWASCGWLGHGEAGRMLLAVADQDGEGVDVYHCGCFRGTLEELRNYIADGDERYRASRTKCADFVSGCLRDGEGE